MLVFRGVHVCDICLQMLLRQRAYDFLVEHRYATRVTCHNSRE